MPPHHGEGESILTHRLPPHAASEPNNNAPSITCALDVTAADTVPAQAAGKPPRTGWRRYTGIIMTLSASLFFSVGVLFAKLLQDYNYHAHSTSFWRYVGIIVPAVPLLLFYEFGYLCQPAETKSKHNSQGGFQGSDKSVCSTNSKEPDSLAQSWTRKQHVSTFSTVWPLTDRAKATQCFYAVLRSTFAVMGVVLRYYALQYLTIGDTSVISYSTPVLVTLLAHFMLGERAGIISVLVAFTTLIGVIIVAKPPWLTGPGSFTDDALIGTGYATASLFCSSMQVILMRKVRSVHFALLTAMVGIIGLVISTAITVQLQDFRYPTEWADGLYVAGLTGTSFLGQMSIILALKFEQAGPVALIRMSDVVIGFLLQYAFLGVVPEWTSVVGGTIVVSGVLVVGARKFLQELPEWDGRRRRFRLLLL